MFTYLLFIYSYIYLSIFLAPMPSSFAQPDVEKDEEVIELKEALLERFDNAACQMTEHRDNFLVHQALWKDNRKDALDRFLNLEENAKEPTLAQFKQQVFNLTLLLAVASSECHRHIVYLHILNHMIELTKM